jgi:site-specific DNA recombinase
MNENEERLKSIEAQKAKIRERYKGVSTDELDVIPALPVANFYEDDREKRVAVYARVSTDDPRQTSSYELQRNHYEDVVKNHQGWKLEGIYADEGISGTSLQHRDQFVRMIEDCKQKKIDLIVTKSVSRFARNVLDCIGYVRELAAMQPPIGVFFETENIYTLNPNSEMSLSFISTLAQEESHNKSEIMNASVEMRFRRGIFLTPPLLGYDRDENGDLVVNEDEANTVRLIFFMYLYGYTCTQIADTLTNLKRQTKKGNTQWSPGSILQILQNERHCGDVLSRKTWTPNYLDHKSKKNHQDRNQYRKKNHHAAIISRDDFIAVQRLISNAKYGNKGILPELQVIPDGVLKGFVSVHPRWAGFRASDYINASNSVYDEVIDLPEEKNVEANSGDFDLRGFEIARSQFFDTQKKCCLTFSNSTVKFSKECLNKLEGVLYVELLIHPKEQLLAVRAADKNNKHAMQWSSLKDIAHVPRSISGTAFTKAIFELFGWDMNCKYRVRGIRKQDGKDSVLVFDMNETEVFIPTDAVSSDPDGEETRPISSAEAKPLLTTSKSICAFPASWAENFGSGYYRHAQAREIAVFSETGKWMLDNEGQPFCEHPLDVPPSEVIESNIRQIISTMKKGEPEDGKSDTDDQPES